VSNVHNIRTVERKIGGRTWGVTTLSAEEGVELMPQLVGLIGPAAGRAISALKGDLEQLKSGDIDVLPALGMGVEELSRALARPESAALLKRLVTRQVTCDGKEVTAKDFGLTFAGDYKSLFQVALLVLEVNFEVPFASWLDAVSGVLAGVKVPISTPAVSLAGPQAST
jgi:hypothetical protein